MTLQVLRDILFVRRLKLMRTAIRWVSSSNEVLAIGSCAPRPPIEGVSISLPAQNGSLTNQFFEVFPFSCLVGQRQSDAKTFGMGEIPHPILKKVWPRNLLVRRNRRF